MASYHLDVKSVQRSAGRSATAAIAYRAAERIECQREGRVHDYRAKAGVEASFIVAPEDAPEWAHDREALWNAAEARETRVNSVTAREWELALPHELDGAGRRELAQAFARELVSRYGVAADVAIHAPHREGDQRNWHAHVLTTTRSLTRDGLTDKTRALDAKQTRGAEVTHMREAWARMQNRALERAGHEERVDHRSLQAQREAALERGDALGAERLDRVPEVKLGPVASAVERREERAAEREGREYVPLTERGAQVHEARAARSLLAELGAELGRVRERVREGMHRQAEQVRERAQLARDLRPRPGGGRRPRQRRPRGAQGRGAAAGDRARGRRARAGLRAQDREGERRGGARAPPGAGPRAGARDGRGLHRRGARAAAGARHRPRDGPGQGANGGDGEGGGKAARDRAQPGGDARAAGPHPGAGQPAHPRGHP